MVFLPERKENAAKGAGKSQNVIEREEEIKKEFKDRVSILAVSYHNLGVEQEFLKMWHEALGSYKQATAFAWKYLGADDGIYKNLSAVYNKAKLELDK